MRRDGAIIRRKIFMPEAKRRHVTVESERSEVAASPMLAADLVDNDTGLPLASRSDRVKFVELWCKQGS